MGDVVGQRSPEYPSHIAIRQCRYGPMMYFWNDKYIGKLLDQYGEFAERELTVLRSIIEPGDVVLDIGANIGTYTIPLSRMVAPGGWVIAFEPARQVFNVLCANIAMSGALNILAHQKAVGGAQGTAKIPLFNMDVPENNFGVSTVGGNDGEPVSVISVDACDLKRCDFIKIDVEGMEADVLAGARQTIANFQPVMWIENDRPAKSANLINIIHEMGYRALWHFAPLLPAAAQGMSDAPPDMEGLLSMDMLCFHRDIETDMTGFIEAIPGDTHEAAMHRYFREVA